jgi:hypothetical protein
MARDPAVLAHQEWLGYVQPSGLVVSIPELLRANARIDQNVIPNHRLFLEALPHEADGIAVPEIPDFPAFAYDVLGWTGGDLWGASGAPALPETLEAPLPEYNETLRPTYALREFKPADPAKEWILLVKTLSRGTNFDQVQPMDGHRWQATPQARFERLLRQTGVPIGLLVNGLQVRLVYAPEKELSGHITFNLADMVKVAGRPIFAAFHMLLNSERLYSLSESERLPAILANSRKYQNVVSTQLANQVLEALYELLRGFQAANDQELGELLRAVLASDPDHVYRGLLTTLLRLVFVLYAEDRNLLSNDAVYTNYYSVTGLYERLRADAGRYPDTMDQRYGAWSQLVTLFRLIYSGGSHGNLRIPPREGYLFDPDRYLFLEGRHTAADAPKIPQVSDGVVFRVLNKLLILDGERLSYRTLAVEQIGSVYEAIMGFELHVAEGQSIAIKAAKKHGAPTTINLDALLATAPEKRQKWFNDATDQKLIGAAVEAIKSATSIEGLLAALDKRAHKGVTPNVVTRGAMIFQPSNERRKSGSHYTPSTLTGPIVEAALAPVLKQLGDNPTPQQILNLKVCDPAMGSGAFLVEACRQLGDALVKAWHAHNDVPVLPPDEDEALYAQRQVSQRCLYGVDKNPMAADLAKLSLWLATLAKDHPFTFLDHLLRAGDSLVGLTRKQIAAFNWMEDKQQTFLEQIVRTRIDAVSQYRQRILAARHDVPYAQLKQELDNAEESLKMPREVGDAVVAAFFSTDKQKARDNARLVLRNAIEKLQKDPTDQAAAETVESAVASLRKGPKGVAPFHWELEFPEVFSFDGEGKSTGGFDLVIGNPPFMGGKRISGNLGKTFSTWIQESNPETNGNVDLVAHFFRRAFALLRMGGAQGLIATNTVAQGDTRRGGLRWIGRNGGDVIFARRRVVWPGSAAVVVSVIGILKGEHVGTRMLDGRPVPRITAFLLTTGTHEDPLPLIKNRGLSFNGCDLQAQAFMFDDKDAAANSIQTMKSLVGKDPRNGDRILPFFGGEDINRPNNSTATRWVIYFGSCSEEEAKRWPDLFELCRNRVAAERRGKTHELETWPFWQYWRVRNDFWDAAQGLPEVLAVPQTGNALAFEFMPLPAIYGHTVCLVPTDTSRSS